MPAKRRTRNELDRAAQPLMELGLTPNEARSYVALLHLASATAAELAEVAGVPRPKVYGALRSLEQRGFCNASGDRVTNFRPVDPELALSEWVRRREHERLLASGHDARLRSQLVGMLPARPEHVPEDMSDVMQHTGGPGPTIEVYERLIETTDRRVDIVHAIPVLQRPTRWNRFETEALERGVQVRILASTRELAIEHRCEQILEAGGEVRIARGTPLKLLVRDDGEEAIVALSSPDDRYRPTCVAIRHPELAAPLQLLFNREWRRSLAFDSSGSGIGRAQADGAGDRPAREDGAASGYRHEEDRRDG